MNLHEIFRRHRYGALPHSQVQHCHGYQSVLFPWQHICNSLSNFLIYWNITQKLFNQSASNFQGKEILSSPSLLIVLLPWVSNNLVSIATYIYNILHVQYSMKMDIPFHQSIHLQLGRRLFMFSIWIVRWHNPVRVCKLTDIVTSLCWELINLTKKVQKEVSQMANHNLPHPML